MSRQEDLIEANSRGLLTGQTKIDFDLAVERGIIKIGDGIQSQQPATGGQPPQTGLGVPTETPVSSFGQQDYQSMTKSILGQYNGGDFSPEKIKVFDELKKRGAFDAPQFNEKKIDVPGVAGYVGETISNIPASAAGVAGDVWSALRHPLETAKGVGKLGLGFGQKVAEAAIPGEQDYEYSKLVDQLIDDFDQKYGSLESMADTMKTDPVRVIGDIAATLSGAGGSLFKGTEVGSKLLGAGAKVEPFTGVGKAVKGATKQAIKKVYKAKTAEELYTSAVKFSTTINEKKAFRIAKTAVDSGIMPTYEGIQNAWGKVNDLSEKINVLVDKAQETGKKIPVEGLFKEFNDLEFKALSESSLPISASAAIKKVRKQITDANEIIGREGLTAKEAQRLKQKTYKELEQYYKKNLETPPTAEARKSVAKQAKLFLEEVVPEIKSLNKKEGSYLELIKALEGPSRRISNRDIIGIGTPIKATAGGVIAGPAGAAIGTGLGILDNPKVKARLAIALRELEQKGVLLSPESSAAMSLIFGISKTISGE